VLDLLNTKLFLGLSFTHHKIGLAALKAHGTTVPDGVVDACHAADGIILGPLSHSDYPPRAQGGINLSDQLRVKLDLFVNVRPVC
jgi:isocitrate/isopropylmalate dehydrogenase